MNGSILIVDDNHDNATVLQHLLKHAGLADSYILTVYLAAQASR